MPRACECGSRRALGPDVAAGTVENWTSGWGLGAGRTVVGGRAPGRPESEVAHLHGLGDPGRAQTFLRSLEAFELFAQRLA